MRTITLLLAVSLACGCSMFKKNSTPKPSPLAGMLSPDMEMSMPPTSSAIYELYSWNDEAKQWHFTMFKFTESSRTYADIVTGPDIISGPEALLEKVTAMPRGTQIFWNFRNIKGFSLPPEQEMEKIYTASKERGVIVDIIRR